MRVEDLRRCARRAAPADGGEGGTCCLLLRKRPSAVGGVGVCRGGGAPEEGLPVHTRLHLGCARVTLRLHSGYN